MFVSAHVTFEKDGSFDRSVELGVCPKCQPDARTFPNWVTAARGQGTHRGWGKEVVTVRERLAYWVLPCACHKSRFRGLRQWLAAEIAGA